MAKEKVYITFGTTPCRMALEEDWKDLAAFWRHDPSALGTREFCTKSECAAYIKGIEDSLGWGDVSCLEDGDVEKLGKYIELAKINPCGE